MKKKFEINKIYSVKSDNYYFGETCGECKGYIYIDYKCVNRTNKTVSLTEGNETNIRTYRIRLDENGNEYIYMKESNRILESE